MRLDPAEVVVETLAELLIQHRAEDHRLLWVTDRRLLCQLVEAGEKVAVHALVDDDGAKGCTPLAGGAEAGEQCCLGGEVEIRARRDDHWVLAAELQAG